ncbi:hypothetical protein [Nocardioides convexus]|uniref:hypothetical protein n=1 Tax=Nocardioides convexus TaxID=2712224 RepID=UPI00241876C1|nr:hypothetical protein [Nocardioides convexus]
MPADLSSPPGYRPGGGAAWRDPWPSYAALRDHDPVHHVAAGDFFVLSRHADVLAAAVDTQTFSSAHGLTVAYDEPGADRPGRQPAVRDDRPAGAHRVPQSLVARGFTPRQVGEPGAGGARLRRRAARPAARRGRR